MGHLDVGVRGGSFVGKNTDGGIVILSTSTVNKGFSVGRVSTFVAVAPVVVYVAVSTTTVMQTAMTAAVLKDVLKDVPNKTFFLVMPSA